MSLGPWEIALIILVIILLFGSKKLPDLARSVGRSMRIFKSEVKEMSNDDDTSYQQQLPQGQQFNQPRQNFQAGQQFNQPRDPQQP